MSADNWTNCHNCQPDLDGDEDYSEGGLDYTFREDYEVYGAGEGSVIFCYSGWCTQCGYGVTFEDIHAICARGSET